MIVADGIESMVDVDGAMLWTSIAGSGLPMVLCNGGPGCDDYLGPIVDLVGDRCRVLRFEPRGCGRSSWDGRYELERTLADLDALRRHYQFDRFVICGHSAGVDMALAYSLGFQEHVVGLIGLAGGRIVDDRTWSRIYHDNLESVGESYGGKEFVADPEVNRIGNQTWKLFCHQPDLLGRIARLPVPAVFIYGTEDIRPSWPTEQLAGLLPDGAFVPVTGAAHCIWLTHGAELAVEMHAALDLIENRIEGEIKG